MADEEGGGGGEGAPAWMATMADLMSLLLTFFVLLLSFANTDVVKFRMMLGSVQDAFGVQKEHPGDVEALATSAVQLSKQESTPHLESGTTAKGSGGDPTQASAPSRAELALMTELEHLITQQGLGRSVGVEASERGVIVRVTGQLMFRSGSAELLPESHPFLDQIGKLTRAFPHDLTIEGHTDDQPIRSAVFPSNWHLSAARAISALRYLSEQGGVDSGRLGAAGFADSRPLVAGDSPEARATNRRVEFIYLRRGGPSIEPVGHPLF